IGGNVLRDGPGWKNVDRQRLRNIDTPAVRSLERQRNLSEPVEMDGSDTGNSQVSGQRGQEKSG
ncbi:MAG TPA: hypothetical protein VJX67_25095, partial [Blastocatellia bacterium]|nr:hypothetical protein [Blastocatellia bacterium]